MDKREEKEKEEETVGDLRMKEKKDRKRRRNNIIIKGVIKLGKNEVEQEERIYKRKSENRGVNRQSIQDANNKKHIYCGGRTRKLAQ